MVSFSAISRPFRFFDHLEGLLRYMLALRARCFNRPVRFVKQFSPATWFDDVAAGLGVITMCVSLQSRASGRWTRA